jgi:hypothetical protein
MLLKNSEVQSMKKEFGDLFLMLQNSGGSRFKAYFTELLAEENPLRLKNLIVGNNIWGGSGSVFDFEAETQCQHVANLLQLRKIGGLLKKADINDLRVESTCNIIDEWVSKGVL